MECPHCGYAAATNARFCRQCGTKLPEAMEVVDEAQRLSTPQDPLVAICPTCRTPNRENLLACARCSGALVGILLPGAPTRACPRCEAPNPELATYCVECGWDMRASHSNTKTRLSDGELRGSGDPGSDAPIGTDVIPRETATEQTTSEEGADSGSRLAWIFGLLGSLWAAIGFATIGLGLPIGSAVLWALIIVIVHWLCLATLVGVLLLPFVVGLVSSIWGVGTPTQWAPPANNLSLAIAVYGGGIFWYFIGMTVGSTITRLVRRLIQRA